MGRNGRIAWGAGALALLALLAVTIPMSGRSLAEAEAEAERWAEERALDVVVAGVAPEIVARDVAGEDYRKLLVRVQAGILADDQASAVRIWRIDGNLLFSTAQRDDVAEVASPDDPSIERAANGEVVSVLTDEATTVPGLRPPKQTLFRTYVPLQPSGATSVMGVVEIDQPYSSIHDPALRLWRLLQVVLGVALVGVLLGFVQSLRHGFAARSVPSAGPSARAEPLTRRDRKRERARSLASRAWPRAQRTDDAREPSTTSEIDVRAVETRMEELDLKVRAAEAEREQQRAEVKRLRDALEEKEAELALARDGANTRGEARRERKVIAEAHKRAAEAERKSAQAEKKSEDAAKRAMEASTRALEMEAQLRSAEETIGALRGELASRPQPVEDGDLAATPRRRDATDRKAAAELKKAQAELKKAQAELSRAQVERDALADERSRLEAEVQRVEAERAGVEVSLAQTRAELQAQIAAASSEAGASMLEERVTTAEMQLADSEERVADAQGRLVRSEASLSDALAKLSELEQTRAALSAELAQLRGAPLDDVVPTDGSGSERPSGASDDVEPRTAGAGTDLEERIQELERARRADITELQRAQESFANTQLELTNASRKLREAEARIRELESELEIAPSRGPVPAAPVDDGSVDVSTSPQDASVVVERDVADEWANWPEPVVARERDAEPGWDPDPEWSPGPEDDEAEAPDGGDATAGLSLRERLARAAAARHRGALS